MSCTERVLYRPYLFDLLRSVAFFHHDEVTVEIHHILRPLHHPIRAGNWRGRGVEPLLPTFGLSLLGSHTHFGFGTHVFVDGRTIADVSICVCVCVCVFVCVCVCVCVCCVCGSMGMTQGP